MGVPYSAQAGPGHPAISIWDGVRRRSAIVGCGQMTSAVATAPWRSSGRWVVPEDARLSRSLIIENTAADLGVKLLGTGHRLRAAGVPPGDGIDEALEFWSALRSDDLVRISPENVVMSKEDHKAMLTRTKVTGTAALCLA
jgi:hypothetical protein